MHNLILGRKWVDHRDGDGLNNRRSNLRQATNAQNQQNTRGRGGSSRYKGVAWYTRHGKWREPVTHIDEKSGRRTARPRSAAAT